MTDRNRFLKSRKEEEGVAVNCVKRALMDGRVSLGSWIQIGHPAIAEVLTNVGFEWLAVDCEHTDIDVAGFAAIARAMSTTGVVPLVRVRENTTMAIRLVLDAGARGVIVPLVNSAEEAERAVNAAKFPPDGIRGFSFCRANNWGMEFAKHSAKANDDVVVVVMAETKAAVDNLDEIAAVDGVDGVFIGPYDLSGSYGVTGQTSHPLVRQACKSIVNGCLRAGKSAGIHIVNPTEKAVETALEEGFTFLALGMDTVFLQQAAKTAMQLRRGES